MKMNICLIVIITLSGMLYGQWPGEIPLQNTQTIERMYPNNWSVAISTSPSQIANCVWEHQITYYYYGVYFTRRPSTMAPKCLSQGAFHPSIAVSGQYIHVVYTKADAYGNPFYGQIYYIRSTNSGSAWSSPIPICTSVYARFPSIASSGNIVHIVWSDNPGGGGYQRDIYYKRSTDNGASWSEAVPLTNAGNMTACMPCICTSNNYVHVVWHKTINTLSNFEIFYKHSTDYGYTWVPGTEIQISDNDLNPSKFPSVAAQNNNVYVTWTDTRNSVSNAEVYFNRSTNNGNTWDFSSSNQLLSTNDAYPSQLPCITVGRGGSGNYVIYVVYQDSKANHINNELWCTQSSDYGNTWVEEQVSANNGYDSQTPAIAALTNTLHVVWDERITDNNYDIYYNQKAFGPPIGDSKNNNYPIKVQQVNSTSFLLSGKLPAAEPVTITMFNSMGRKISKKTYNPSCNNLSFIWSINDLPKGVYFLRMNQPNDWQKSVKLVIVR